MMSASEGEHALSMCCVHLVNVLLMFTPLQAPQSCVCDQKLTDDCNP